MQRIQSLLSQMKYELTKIEIVSKKQFENFQLFLQFEKRSNNVFNILKSMNCDNNII